MSSTNVEAEKRLVEKRFDTGEVVLNYAEGPPNGPPFVILPGYYNEWQSYKSLIPTLETQYHLYIVDARGRGKSGRTPRRYKLKHLAADTMAFLKQIVGEPSILFGHSMGGWMSLWAAYRNPEYVKAIILGDSPLNIQGMIKTASTKEWREDGKREREWSGKPVDDLIKIFKERNPDMDMDLIMLMAETFSSVDPEVSSYWAEGGFEEFFEGFAVKDILGQLRIPLLVLQANPEMGMIGHGDVEWARAIMPELSHVYLGEINHWLGIRDKREHLFINAVTPFLESLR
jgi:pimeloyl-ACP methyl ester carboxylesterase